MGMYQTHDCILFDISIIALITPTIIEIARSPNKQNCSLFDRRIKDSAAHRIWKYTLISVNKAGTADVSALVQVPELPLLQFQGLITELRSHTETSLMFHADERIGL